MTYLAQIRNTVAGIPCEIGVTHYLHQPPFSGSAVFCDSPDDYYGYTEVEFDVLDQRGRPAAWLEKKLTQREKDRIEGEVLNHMGRRDE